MYLQMPSDRKQGEFLSSRATNFFFFEKRTVIPISSLDNCITKTFPCGSAAFLINLKLSFF